MNQDDAAAIILEWLETRQRDVAHYGYEVHVPTLIRAYLESQNPRPQRDEVERSVRDFSPDFYSAAWDLCRRGVLRPGVWRDGEQITEDGSGGNGYSLTPLGRQYLAELDVRTLLPLGPGRFEQMMQQFLELLGPGFCERAGEAIRCYRAMAYVACCAMTGAAAESLVLAAAIAKTNDEEAVLREYATAQGRSRIERMLVGQAQEHIRRELRGFMVLLKYWRDQASHGIATQISDNEAYTSLHTLLRFAHFASDHWADLTRRV